MSHSFVEQDSTTARRIAQLLRTDSFLSGVKIAESLGLSRAAVSEHVQKMRLSGMPVAVVKGRGYRLMQAFTPLDADSLARNLADLNPLSLESGHVLWSVDSTNRFLARGEQPMLGRMRFCLAEFQTAGRGRRGRNWVSPLGASLYLSLVWRSAMEPAALQGLSLSVGIAVAETLADMGVDDITLKWPNDLLVGGKKLGGILMELSGMSGGPSSVVIGLGLNIGLDASRGASIDQPWTDLASLLPGRLLERTDIATRVIRQLVDSIQQFSDDGGVDLVGRWKRFDGLRGKAVVAFQGDQRIPGVAEGIDETGALLLRTEIGVRRFLSGEISIREPDQDAPDQGALDAGGRT